MKFAIGVICAAAAMLVSCTKSAPIGPKIDPALAGLVPPDTILLAGTRLDDIQTTNVYKKYLAEVDFAAIDRFAEETGVNPRKDLWELLYVSNGKQSALIGRGKFSDESEPRFEKFGGRRFAYKGSDLVGDERTAILMVLPTVLAVGDTPELEALVDARQNSNGVPPGMTELMKDIPSDSQFWAAYKGGPIDLSLPSSGNLSNINTVLHSIQSGTLYFDFRLGIAGTGTGMCQTDQAANELESGLKALVGMGRLSTPSNQPDLQRVWDGIRVTNQNRQVKLYITEPEELVEKSLDLWTGKKR